jgi:hypothetical protein
MIGHVASDADPGNPRLGRGKILMDSRIAVASRLDYPDQTRQQKQIPGFTRWRFPWKRRGLRREGA